MNTDAKRLQQILKNLLSNAFKFTDKGKVALEVRPATDGWSPDNQSLNSARQVLAFSVTDTGIGIPAEKQQIIFEAFQQADGSTSRKYGGTGLGLAISREIAGLLGGEIRLHSVPDQGSTFTLYLPQHYSPTKPTRRNLPDTPSKPLPALEDLKQASPGRITEQFMDGGLVAAGVALTQADVLADPEVSGPAPNTIGDDSGDIQDGDRILLIVENDTTFARFLLEMGHENGFKAVIATRGAQALQLARELRPDAITLDINLPDIDGWRVLNRLKDDLTTRHIPVQVITTDEERERPLRMGAMGVLTKPVKTKEPLDETFGRIKRFIEPHTRRALVVEHDAEQQRAVCEQIAADGVEAVCVGSAAEAVERMRDGQGVDLIVAGLDLPDKPGFDFIDDVKEDPALREVPMIVNVQRELTKKEQTHLKRLTQATVLKDVRSPERLFDEAALFLHRPVEAMPEGRRKSVEQLHHAGAVLAGKKVLIVDDDIRNIFAMTSLLEPYNMSILSAETGRGAIEMLQDNTDVDVVLMDIMMPDMDGYDTMRAIRKLSKFRQLPIIALTAKAMKGDREKCIDAGASDYISKPVDTEQLLAMLRVWLYR